MRTEVFKTEREYEEWEEKDGNCIYCITDYTSDGSEGEFICDMIESDFIELVDAGLINSEGFYYLLKPLTDKQKDLLKENHGIRIIILEEELALTPKQKELVEDFNRLGEKMSEEKIGIVWDAANLCFAAYNETNIEGLRDAEWADWPDIPKEAVDIDNSLDWDNIGIRMYDYNSEKGNLHAIFK